MTVTGLRYRLSRRIAPRPVMDDPLEGADGTFVVVRREGLVMTLRADRFRMRTRTHFPKDWNHEKSFGDFSRLFGSTTTFVGTAHR